MGEVKSEEVIKGNKMLLAGYGTNSNGDLKRIMVIIVKVMLNIDL